MTYYHGTDVRLSPGDVLRPGDRSNYQPGVYQATGVFLSDSLAWAFFYGVFGAFSAARFEGEPHIYEVEPQGRAISSGPGEWVASSATILREVTREAKAAFSARWEGFYKPGSRGRPEEWQKNCQNNYHKVA